MLDPDLREKIAGFALGLAGMALLSGMDAVGKALGAHLPILEIVAIRYLGGALILAFYIAATRRAWPNRKNLWPHILRGSLMALTLFLFFYGATHLPLAVATALAMLAPVYIAIFGALLLKEPLSKRVIAALVLALAGAGIIIAVTHSGDAIIGKWPAWAAALAAPITYAASILLTKYQVTDDRPITMAFGQSIFAGLIVLPIAVPGMLFPATELIWLCVLLALLGAIGGILIIEGLKRLPASVFALIDYTALIWATMLGLVFFSERPGPLFWLGGLLIIAACALGLTDQKRTSPMRSSGAAIS